MGPGTNATTTAGKRKVRKNRGEEDGQAWVVDQEGEETQASCVDSCAWWVAFILTYGLGPKDSSRIASNFGFQSLTLPFCLCFAWMWGWEPADCDIVVLAFVVCGGIFFELLKLAPTLWSFIMNVLAKLGVIGKGD
jgi:hypothetical protein